MIDINIEKLDGSIVLYLAGRATVESARELKLGILSCITETDHLVIDARMLSFGDVSFFQIVISGFRDMIRQGKRFTFLPSEHVKRDASLLFGDFSLVCELLGMDPVQMRDILLGDRSMSFASPQPV